MTRLTFYPFNVAISVVHEIYNLLFSRSPTSLFFFPRSLEVNETKMRNHKVLCPEDFPLAENVVTALQLTLETVTFI